MPIGLDLRARFLARARLDVRKARRPCAHGLDEQAAKQQRSAFARPAAEIRWADVRAAVAVKKNPGRRPPSAR
jgi:hypothetical protein